MPALSIRRIVEIQSGARLWPDERTAWRAFARGSLRPGDDGILSRREKSGTCCCSSTISFGFRKRARKYPRCSGAPQRVGYQPTLAAEMGDLQERSHQLTKVRSLPFRRFTFPADDLTDPAPANTFAHLDSTLCLNVRCRAWDLSGGRSPGIDFKGARTRSGR